MVMPGDGCASMEGAVVSLSGYSGSMRKAVKLLVQAAGATLTGDFSPATNTHLVRAEGRLGGTFGRQMGLESLF